MLTLLAEVVADDVGRDPEQPRAGGRIRAIEPLSALECGEECLCEDLIAGDRTEPFPRVGEYGRGMAFEHLPEHLRVVDRLLEEVGIRAHTKKLSTPPWSRQLDAPAQGSDLIAKRPVVTAIRCAEADGSAEVLVLELPIRVTSAEAPP